MANKIVDLFQLDEGTRNPATNLVEKPVWNIRFHDGRDIEDKLFFKSTICFPCQNFTFIFGK